MPVTFNVPPMGDGGQGTGNGQAVPRPLSPVPYEVLAARLVHDPLAFLLGLLQARGEVDLAVEDRIADVLEGRLQLGVAQVVRDRERPLALPVADPVGDALEDVAVLVRLGIAPDGQARGDLTLGP